ncbi:MAG: hypothetical protein IJ113_02215 [Eggerthellaceae bacterium]|nr:hypothetical protein [Eggerthellaceae bacterium]
MTHRTVNQAPEENPQIEQILEAVLLQALDIAKEKLDEGELLVPFTALAVGETLFIETHPAEDPDDCFKMAQHTVQHASGALAYAFCYDGYVDTNDGELDAIIAEGGIPGSEVGHAVGYLYTVEGEGEERKFKIEDKPLYIGQAPNFMEYTLLVTEDELDEDDRGERDDDEGEGAGEAGVDGEAAADLDDEEISVDDRDESEEDDD